MRPDTTIWVKPPRSVVEIGFTARDARKAVLRTLVLGAATGFLLGAIAGTVVAHVTDASMALGWFTAALAMLFGALVALLWGPPASQPALTAAVNANEPLELTVETTEVDDREWAAELLLRGHARVERRPTTLEEQPSSGTLRPA